MKKKIGMLVLVITFLILVIVATIKNNGEGHASPVVGIEVATKDATNYKVNIENELLPKIGLAIGQEEYPIGGIEYEFLPNKTFFIWRCGY